MGIPGDEVTVENDHTSLAVRVFSLGQIRPMVYSRNSFALFWDDRAGSLEHQSTFPVEGPVEMDRHWDDAIREIQSHPIYPDMFEAAFGSQHVTIDRVTRAIAQFERTFRSYNSKWDRVQRGEDSLSASERRGFDAFTAETGDCFHCHGGNLALRVNPSNAFTNNGLDAIPEAGLRDSTSFFLHEGLCRTPTLLGIANTAPYFHDNSTADLRSAVDHYALDFFPSTEAGNIMEQNGLRTKMSEDEIDDIVSFLEAISVDPTGVPLTCGDGFLNSAEACDDGNLVDADGCSMTCQTEAEFECAGEPSTCVVICSPSPRICDVNADGTVDRDDIDLIFEANDVATDDACDSRDFDKNGLISIRDGQACTAECDRFLCMKNACGLLGIEVIPLLAFALLQRRRAQLANS